ncbi:MAG: TonB-dependent receptor [Candidatus Kapaibacterium sp.]
MRFRLYYKFILILFFSSLVPVLSGSSISILDKASKKPMLRATVHFKSLSGITKDSVSVRLSDKTGKVVNPFDDKTQIMVSYIGYNTYIDTIDSKIKIIYLSHSDIFTDDVVVTGQFNSTSIKESVHNVKVISETRIQSQAANNLRELLMTEANLRISQDNILGSKIDMNGLSGENVKIMIDGVPIIGRLDGNIDISQINLNNIAKVEIIDGPMSSIYGSDALGGVINLITKEADCDRVEFDFNSYNESVGAHNFDGTLRAQLFNINFLANAGRNLFRGHDYSQNTRNIRWDPKEQYFFDVQLKTTIDNHKIRFQSRYFNEFILNRGALRAPYYETAFDDKYRTQRFSNTFFYDGKVDEARFINLTAGYSTFNRKKNTYFKNMITLDEQITANESDQDTSDFAMYMLRAVFSDNQMSEFFKYQVGLDLNIDVAEGMRIENFKKQMNDIAGFANLQFLPVTGLTIQPSLRYINNSQYDAPLVPALNLKYDIIEDLTVRASYAKGFRSPSIKELFFEFIDINHNIVGNKDLKAENSDSYNLSMMYSSNNQNYFFSFEPKVFYNVILDLITLANVEGTVYKNVNIGKYETIGYSTTFKYMRENIALTAIGAYIGRINLYHEEFDSPKFNYTPEFSINFDFNIEEIDSKLNIFYKYTGKMPGFSIIDDEIREYFINHYNLMDMSLTHNFNDLLNVGVGIKNVFDVNDINSSMAVSSGSHTGGGEAFPIAWGRTFFVNLNLRLK